MPLRTIAPLPLNHSWPLFEARARLGVSLPGSFGEDAMPSPLSLGAMDAVLAARGVGLWECDLRDNRLSWSAGVYDLFGLPRDMAVDRDYSVSLYSPSSRVVMEYLRAYAIRHKRGFTVDVELCLPGGDYRWMRLSAAPVLEGGKVVRLCGVKVDVTMEYGGEYDGGLSHRLAA